MIVGKRNADIIYKVLCEYSAVLVNRKFNINSMVFTIIRAFLWSCCKIFRVVWILFCLAEKLLSCTLWETEIGSRFALLMWRMFFKGKRVEFVEIHRINFKFPVIRSLFPGSLFGILMAISIIYGMVSYPLVLKAEYALPLCLSVFLSAEFSSDKGAQAGLSELTVMSRHFYVIC